MDTYKEMREILKKNGVNSNELNFGYKFFNDNVFDFFYDNNLLNKKGDNFIDRFRDIVSDPNNLFIERCKNSGKLENGLITLHNGVKIFQSCYYDDFSNIFLLNDGVHEPSEERAFCEVLKHMKNGSIMIELGSYWAFYSMWFLKEIKNSTVHCIEGDLNCMQAGINNFKLNELQGVFKQGFVSKDGLNINDYCKNNNIIDLDILHADIQGFELEMLHQISPMLDNNKIKYLFISTHSDFLHYSCINFLKSKNYRIVCSCEYERETFQYDGFILACPIFIEEIKSFKIGNREKTKLISLEYFNELYNNKIKI
jgi:hypothetical protein